MSNREKIISKAIRDMRFVKIEFLSTMRRYRELAMSKNQDEVKLISSGINKDAEVVFPYDGNLFPDEVFHISSEVKSLCQRSRK